jgi:hypothetical protein
MCVIFALRYGGENGKIRVPRNQRERARKQDKQCKESCTEAQSSSPHNSLMRRRYTDMVYRQGRTSRPRRGLSRPMRMKR